MSHVTERWEKTGLLDRIHVERKAELAILLNDISIHLIRKNKICPLLNDETFNGLILPVARRIFSAVEGSMLPTPSAEFLIEDFQKFLLNHKMTHDIIENEEMSVVYFYVKTFEMRYMQDIHEKLKFKLCTRLYESMWKNVFQPLDKFIDFDIVSEEITNEVSDKIYHPINIRTLLYDVTNK